MAAPLEQALSAERPVLSATPEGDVIHDRARGGHGKRQVPLSPELVAKLRAWHGQTESPHADDLVFSSLTGTPLDPNNLRTRTLKPVAKEVGAPWAGFHTFRHTYASLMLAGGANVLQLSRALGHPPGNCRTSPQDHSVAAELRPEIAPHMPRRWILAPRVPVRRSRATSEPCTSHA